MANYRAGDVIRLTRNAIGMTQEQLCEEICSVETLSRIENNKQGIGKDVYERLMAKMERNPLRSYAICSSMDMRIAEEKQALEDAVAKVDYEKAKSHLEAMKQMMSDTAYNQQYLARFEALIAYHTKEIDEEELISRLDKAIRMTLPKYEKYLENEKVFPFTEQEIFSLMSLANAYAAAENKAESISLLNRLLYNLNKHYMDEKSMLKLRLIIEANCIKYMSESNQNAEALRRAQTVLKIAIKFDYGHVIPNLIVNVAWNSVKMIKNEELKKEEIKELKKILRQAYYIADARGDNANRKLISEYFIQTFGESL